MLDYVNVSLVYHLMVLSWKIYLFFITEMHTSDGQGNAPVTTKLHVVMLLINTSDVHVLLHLSLLYIY
jgi:hypothetical protein